MATIDDLKHTFFDECGELLQEIEGGLTDIREGRGSEDTVHAVFRAAHSVKGGAGIFGFETLVEFAHVFETVLDGVRRGSLSPTPDVLAVLLKASDVLSDLVGMARSGDAAPPGYGDECRAALKALLNSEDETGISTKSDGSMADDGLEGIDFVPVRADLSDAIDGIENDKIYHITFRPTQEMLRSANEPLYILRELRKLGELELVAETGALPPLPDLIPDHPYLSWKVTLRTSVSRREIDEVFEFVAGDCELQIVESSSSSGEIATASETAVTSEDHSAGVTDVGASSPENTSERISSMSSSGGAADLAREARTAVSKPVTTTTRVDLEKIDRVVNMVGELVIAQAMLGQVVRDLPEDVSGRLSQILEEVIHHTRELKDSVMSMRAQPVRTVFQRMPRLVRELSAKTAKKVRLDMYGESTEVDKTIIERLSDPLTHIIRNAIDHGIEAPAERVTAGKSEQGTIRLSAEHRGGRIVIEISDDGAGINYERVLKKAREKGLVDSDAVLSDDEISNLIFLPGFSTANAVSDISGRGVGMDVVRRNIQDLGGRITLKSELGRGMTIQLALPLTLAVMEGMVVEVGRENYVIPISAIVECLRPSRSDLQNLLGTHGTLQLRGTIVPLIHIGDLFDVASTTRNVAESVVIVVEAGEGTRLGLVVDELRGHQQVVIKSIEENYGAVPGIAAATILGNGRVAFILDVERLSDLAGPNFDAVPATGTERPMTATVN